MAFSESELLLEYHSGVTTAHRNLLQCDSLSDLHVTVGQRSFPCHKLIMTSWSGYFRSMLNSDWRERHESQVTLPVDDIISAASFELIYNWIYRGQLEPTLDNLDLMLPTALYLQMHKVLGMCVEHMQLFYNAKDVPVNRMVQNLVLGKRFDIAPLRQMALRGIATRFDSFLSSIDFREHADVEDILTILKNPDLVTSSEDVVFQIAIGWLRHKSERLDHLTDVLENIRLCWVATQTLRECLDHQVMSHSVTSCDLLLDVLCQHASPACQQRLERCHPKVLQGRTRNPETPRNNKGRRRAATGTIYAGMARDIYQGLRECDHQPPDVTVSVESSDFPVHKAILVGWSGYFRRLLSEGSPETVSLSGEAMTADNLDILLNWIYLGEYHVTAKNVCDVFVCARSLQMDSIAELLDKYWKQVLAPKLDFLSGSDLMALLLRARIHNLSEIHQTILNTVVHNFNTLKNTQEFQDVMNLDDFLFVLQHDELQADNENQVFQAVIEWLQHCEDRHKDLAKVIKVVRMAFVDVPIIRMMLNKIASPDADSYQILLNALTRDSDPASLESLRAACPGMFNARKTTSEKKVLVRYGYVLDLTADQPRWREARVPALEEVTSFCEVLGYLYGVRNQTLVRWNCGSMKWESQQNIRDLTYVASTRNGTLLLMGVTSPMGRHAYHQQSPFPPQYGLGFNNVKCVYVKVSVRKLDLETNSVQFLKELKWGGAIYENKANPSCDVAFSVGGLTRPPAMKTARKTVPALLSVCCSSKNTLLLLGSHLSDYYELAELDPELNTVTTTSFTTCGPLSGPRLVRWRNDVIILSGYAFFICRPRYVQPTQGGWTGHGWTPGKRNVLTIEGNLLLITENNEAIEVDQEAIPKVGFSQRVIYALGQSLPLM